jgi:hypothetical protein
MSAALASARPRAVFAVLDVPHARLRLAQARADEQLFLLLRGEAAAFAAIHAAL